MKNLVIFIFFILFVSCTNQDLDNYLADNILYTLSVSSDKISVSPVKEKHSITIKSNTEWIAKTTDEWIIIEDVVEKSLEKLEFFTIANTTSSERVGKIGIYCLGKHKKDIIVQQENVDLRLNTDTISGSSCKSDFHFSLYSNGSWSISTPFEWIQIMQNEGVGNAEITITIDELMSSKERIGYLLVTDQSSQTKKIAVKQLGKYLNVSVDRLSFLASGDNVENIILETDGLLEYTNDSWITCIENSNTDLNVKVSENISGKSKKGSLFLKLKDVEDFIPIEISVYQAPIIVNASIVDLGLSVKWASHNIGSTNDDEIGGHYLYGEGADFIYKWYDIPYNILPDCVTGTIYDTANSFWGGHWRVPTKKEWNELYNNCTIELIDFPNFPGINVYNEITGVSYNWGMANNQAYKFTAKNGNYIVLPIAGSWYYYIPYEGWAGDGINIYGMCEYKTATKQDRMVIESESDGLSWSYGGWDGWFTSVRAVWDK